MPKLNLPGTINRWAVAGETSESPIEQIFHMMLIRLLAPEASLVPQHPLNTHRGHFRADFLLVSRFGERLVLECDGKEFHDPVRDAFRDAFTLASHCADFVYRFDGATIQFNIWYALYAIARHHAGVFSCAGLRNLPDSNHSCPSCWVISLRLLIPERALLAVLTAFSSCFSLSREVLIKS